MGSGLGSSARSTIFVLSALLFSKKFVVLIAGVSGASTGSIDASRMSIDKDLEDQGRLGLGLYANGILFGLQVRCHCYIVR